MNVVILTDIFGCCQSVDSLVIFLEKYDVTVTVIDPYDKEFYQFQNEAEAYDMFIEKCGHDAYLTMAKSIISTLKPTLLIGFSAGASVLWQLSAWEGLDETKILCFYPSQIRYHLAILPSAQIHVVFPHKENTFDVNIVSNKIQHTKNVQTEITAFGHGFMNRCSEEYSQEGEKMGWNFIIKEIILQRDK